VNTTNGTYTLSSVMQIIRLLIAQKSTVASYIPTGSFSVFKSGLCLSIFSFYVKLCEQCFSFFTFFTFSIYKKRGAGIVNTTNGTYTLSSVMQIIRLLIAQKSTVACSVILFTKTAFYYERT
jgi:hypothetical protein